jgi:hypothetical protein
MRFGFREITMTKIITISLQVLTLVGGVCTSSHGKDLFVIAHPGIAITAEEIQDVFIGDKQFAGSQKLTVIDNASAQGEFLSKVVRMESKRYSSLWVKKSFRDGLAIPAVKGGDAEVLSFVKNNPGAIGYVSVLPDGVKALAKFP